MGVFKDKEYEKIAAVMAPLAKSIHTLTLPDRKRSLPAEMLAEVMQKYCPPDISIQSEPDEKTAVENALSEAKEDDIILAFGSLSYLGEIIKTVHHITINTK